MLRKFIRFWKYYIEHKQFLDTVGAFKLLLFNYLKKQTIIKVRIAGEKIYIRTNSQDFEISKLAFVDKEYDSLRCKDPKVIVDAGAHIGTTTLFFARKYPNAKIIAIEPQKDNYELLRLNVGKYANVILLNTAIWSTHEAKTLVNRNNSHLGYTIVESSIFKEQTTQQIDCISIQGVIDRFELSSIDLLKMDVEGAEKAIFATSEDWINKIKIITIELHDRIVPGCEETFYNATKSFDHFEESGEKVVAYNKKALKEILN